MRCPEDHARPTLRAPWLLASLLSLALGCASTEPDPGDEGTIIFLEADSEQPRASNSPLEVILRPQGGFGAEVDLRVVGVDDVDARFTIEILDPAGELLAQQPFLPTSTAMARDDGSFVIFDLPVVFADEIGPDQIDGAPARLRATMETSPPARGELVVVLEQVQ